MLKHKTITDEIIKTLYSFACTPFQLRMFRNRWEKLGWRYLPTPGDEYSFTVQVPGYWSFNINPLGKRVLGAVFPFCYWETFLESSHRTHESWSEERAMYNEIYETTLDLALKTLPPPIAHWKDEDKDGHQAAIWEGDNGLLILQQACLDPQFGIEIDFWLDSCAATEFKPKTPLIDWLCQRDIQAQDGPTPPLDWS